jgi:hypothetical protein
MCAVGLWRMKVDVHYICTSCYLIQCSSSRVMIQLFCGDIAMCVCDPGVYLRLCFMCLNAHVHVTTTRWSEHQLPVDTWVTKQGDTYTKIYKCRSCEHETDEGTDIYRVRVGVYM